MTTLEELETALEEKGWEPDYREDVSSTGEELEHPVYEIIVDEIAVTLELASVNSDEEIVSCRIWEYDPESETIDDIWDVDDVSTTKSIINEIKSFVANR